MGWRDSAAELWSELKQQRLRALLSLSGIAWGTLSILLLLAFSVGFEELFEERQRGLGDGVAITLVGLAVFLAFGRGEREFD